MRSAVNSPSPSTAKFLTPRQHLAAQLIHSSHLLTQNPTSERYRMHRILRRRMDNFAKDA